MNQNNAVAEALANEIERQSSAIRVNAAPELYLADVLHFAIFVRLHVPTIIAALKAQRVDEGGVS